MIGVSAIKKISLSRYLHQLAVRELKSSNELSIFTGVNMLHDAVEAFLLGVAEHVDAKVSPNTKFEQYLEVIDAKIAPKRLPFRSKLLRLNRVRVNSKHYVLRPDDSEISDLLLAVKEFCDEVSESVLKINFDTVTLVDLLDDGRTKEILKNAEQELAHGLYVDCLISCRKALYLEIEQDYDVARVRDDTLGSRGLYVYISKAPSYAKNKDYIEKHVREPTDFIVFNDFHLQWQLTQYRIDPTEFWNVLRLTPKVYFDEVTKSWAINREVGKLDIEDVGQKAEYILPVTVNIILCVHLQRRGTMRGLHLSRFLLLKKEEIPVYEKAQRSSRVVTTTPKGVRTVLSDHSLTGLDGESYWCIDVDSSQWSIGGYIHNDDVQGSAFTPSEIKALLGVEKRALSDRIERR